MLRKVIVFTLLIATCFIGCSVNKSVLPDSQISTDSKNYIIQEETNGDNSKNIAINTSENYRDSALWINDLHPNTSGSICSSIKISSKSRESLTKLITDGTVRDHFKTILSKDNYSYYKNSPIRLVISYAIPLDNVSNYTICKILFVYVNENVRFTNEESQKLYRYLSSIPIKFQYEQYMNFDKGYVILDKPIIIK